jgi:hypothetical protein
VQSSAATGRLLFTAVAASSLLGPILDPLTAQVPDPPPADARAGPLQPRDLGELPEPGPDVMKLPAILTPKLRQAAPGDDELRRLLIDRYNAVVAELRLLARSYQQGQIDISRMIPAAQRLTDSERELCTRPADEVTVLEKYVELLRFNEKRVQALALVDQASPIDLEQTRYSRLDAEIQLLRAKRRANPQATK